MITAKDLYSRYPVLLHMADKRNWDGIQKHGLLGTTALLDLYEIKGEERKRIEEAKRTEIIEIKSEKYGNAYIRDQIPLHDSKLAGSLTDCTVEEWYRILNERVFFWLNEQRLCTLLCAKAYAEHEHIVLTIDSKPLIEKYQDTIELTAMNTGSTSPMAHPRGKHTFRKLADYPYEQRLKKNDHDAVAELTVPYGVPDIMKYVISAELAKCHEKTRKNLKKIYP